MFGSEAVVVAGVVVDRKEAVELETADEAEVEVGVAAAAAAATEARLSKSPKLISMTLASG